LTVAEELNRMTTPVEDTAGKGSIGDWIEARGLPGLPSRRGQITEVLGRTGHKHYRVRWDERHESIVYPADGVIVFPQRERSPRGPRAS
jgi:hypothetical protein